MTSPERQLEEQLIGKLRDLHGSSFSRHGTFLQIELKTLGINPRRAIEQIVDYKHDPGNRNTSICCFGRPSGTRPR